MNNQQSRASVNLTIDNNFVRLTHRLMDQNKSAVKDELIYGVVEEALPNTLFRVTIEGEDETVLAYLSGKMRRYRIRVLVGDKVGMVIDPYGGKARITKRQ